MTHRAFAENRPVMHIYRTFYLGVQGESVGRQGMGKIHGSRSQQLMLAGAVGLPRFCSPNPWINPPTGGSSSHTFHNILWHVARGQRCGRSRPGSNPERRGRGWRREGPRTPPLASAAQGTDEVRLEDYLSEAPDSPRNGKQEKIFDVLAWLTAMSSHDTNKAQ